eukprot:CAMPEP_0203751622 /NCGR_PEP_ID=MMETSP0098-20131031/5666_1 /ASSEMBLY_ACC=CAM_ASM_000208 /TAXON_ID=96639 /ORGANISM=" , Strain NY0313808BC1" /LENGTH=465 /DNA_ID=CAMNT_0050641427 /DNA_START=82 /DNA_END=1476 /DNA_ORIENTATION=+
MSKRTQAERWVERLELDFSDAKDSFRKKLSNRVSQLEQSILYGSESTATSITQQSSKTQSSTSTRETIAKVHVRIKSLVSETDIPKAYFKIEVEGESLNGPVAFRKGGLALVWEISATFDLTDISSTIRIVVYSSNLVAADKCLGCVEIPLDLSGKRLTAAYHLYPPSSSKGTHLIVPGEHTAMGTALDRELFDDTLLLTVSHQLELPEGALVWPLYFRNRRFGFENNAFPDFGQDTPSQLSINNVPDILDSVTKARRNMARVKSSFVNIGSSLPVALWQHLRSWEYPAHTLTAIIGIVVCDLYMPRWTLPIMCFGLLLLLSILSTRKTPHASWVVWNEDIKDDPDIDKTQLEKLTKAVQNIENVAKVLDIVATTLEKIVNTFNFSDPIATGIVLYLIFFGLVLPTAMIFSWISLGTVAVVMIACIVHGMFGPATVLDKLVPIFDRIPCNNDLGQRWINKQQTVQ